jgi:hypothetical protein
MCIKNYTFALQIVVFLWSLWNNVSALPLKVADLAFFFQLIATYPAIFYPRVKTFSLALN